MKTPALVAVVTTLHILAVAAFIFIQGCGTPGPSVEPPPAPVLPPTAPPRDAGAGSGMEPPVFYPPGPVEQASGEDTLGPGQTYVVQKGDTLGEIAKRYGVKTRDIAQLNKIKNVNQIRVGQKLMLPAHAKAGKASQRSVRSAPRAVAGEGEYIVQKGDSLSKIARRYGTTVGALKDANGLTSDRILVGQKLVLPGSGAAPAPKPRKPSARVSEPEPEIEEAEDDMADIEIPVPRLAPERAFEYTVGEGETLDSIARDFVVLKEELMQANNISDPDSIQPGQKLIIPMPASDL